MLIARYVPKNCMACKSCELACALKHSTSGDINDLMSEYPRPLSRLKIEVKDGKLHMTRCLHCIRPKCIEAVSYTHLRAHETGRNLVCRLLLEKKKKQDSI